MFRWLVNTQTPKKRSRADRANGDDDDDAIKAMSIDIHEELMRLRYNSSTPYILSEGDIRELFDEANSF